MTAFDRFYDNGHQPKDAMDLAIEDARNNKLGEYGDALSEYRRQHEELVAFVRKVSRDCTPVGNGVVPTLNAKQARVILASQGRLEE